MQVKFNTTTLNKFLFERGADETFLCRLCHISKYTEKKLFSEKLEYYEPYIVYNVLAGTKIPFDDLIVSCFCKNQDEKLISELLKYICTPLF